MIKKISKTQAIILKLKKRGKASYLDKPRHLKAILVVNKEMEEVKRDHKMKDRKSQISAANVVLNA